jgi:peptide/nickel transport system substrate-binding protein
MGWQRIRAVLVPLAVLMLVSTACGDNATTDEAPVDDTTETDVEQTDDEEDGAADSDESATPGDPQVGGTLVAAVAEDLDATDPHRTSGETGPVWLSLIFETLVFIDQDATVVPGLAETWDISDDGATYTFTLREGVTFHNGRELTSEDVKWNYERIADPDTGAASAAVFGIVESIETPDDRTVVLQLSEPSGALLSDLALQGRVGIVAPESYSDAGDMEGFIGTGPYRYESYTVNDRLVLTRNAEYWNEPAYIEQIEVRILPDGTSRLAALASGEVDFAWNLPPEQAESQAASGSFTLQPFPQNRGNYFAINPNLEPFDDVRVRRAMHLAVSREDIASVGWSGYALPNDQPFEPSSFWYVERDTQLTADLDEARALMDEAGVEGAEVTILQWDALGSAQEAQLVASAWEEIGISTSIEIVDIGTLVEAGGSGDFGVLYLWVGLNLDPNRPYAFWEAGSPRNPVVGNFSTPELTDLVVQGRQETDQDRRKEIYAEALDINYAEGGTFYTVSPQQFVGVGERLQGYEQGAFYVWYEGGGLTHAWLED